ncbi:hypothetical protein FLAN108750_14180 [Flavobacterium antarcticum]|uniref:hypothetical protein n=1 Tax=Flavobacterium antarcticum TaxID=271155 RepID=UPI0003B5A09F|nr:hypothetical protein [Flavobacterium antarcticum]
MGIFGNLFGSKKSNNPSNPEIRSEYNLMSNIALMQMIKYENTVNYKLIEDGIYEDLNDEDDAKYRMTISYVLEPDNANNQYPLKDILDKYLMHASDFQEAENDQGSTIFLTELGGYLEKMKEVKEIIGKKVFNRDFLDHDGKVSVDLIIE